MRNPSRGELLSAIRSRSRHHPPCSIGEASDCSPAETTFFRESPLKSACTLECFLNFGLLI